MDINDFMYILEIIKYGSISKAAISLFTTQSGLSRKITKIENYLGFQIFIRNNSGAVLTEKGKGFIDEILPIVSKYNNIIEKYIKKEKTTYKIASAHCTKATDIFYNNNNYKKNLDIESILFSTTNNDNIIEGVHNREIDLGIIGTSDVHYKELKRVLDSKEIIADNIYLCKLHVHVKCKSPLYNRESINYRELQDLRILKLAPLYRDTKFKFDKELELLGLKNIKNAIYANNYHECNLALEDSNTFALGGNFDTILFASCNINPIIIEDTNIHSSVMFITRKDNPLASEGKEFIQSFYDIPNNIFGIS